MPHHVDEIHPQRDEPEAWLQEILERSSNYARLIVTLLERVSLVTSHEAAVELTPEKASSWRPTPSAEPSPPPDADTA